MWGDRNNMVQSKKVPLVKVRCDWILDHVAVLVIRMWRMVVSSLLLYRFLCLGLPIHYMLTLLFLPSLICLILDFGGVVGSEARCILATLNGYRGMVSSALGAKVCAIYEEFRLAERLGLSNLLVLFDSLSIIQMLWDRMFFKNIVLLKNIWEI